MHGTVSHAQVHDQQQHPCACRSSTTQLGAPKAKDDPVADALAKGSTVAEELSLAIILCAQPQSG